jgi:hypothetical protein
MKMTRTIKILISLLLLFILHRVQAWSHLSGQYADKSGVWWQEGLTGLLSDIWMASLLALPFWIFEFFPKTFSKTVQKFTTVTWLMLWGILTAGHQIYVEFFKFQIIPFHLTYLIDQSFISANGSSLFNPSAVVIGASAAGMAYWALSSKKYKQRRKLLILFVGVMLGSVVAHAINIRLRVNWFVIEPLQTNYIEALYMNLWKKPHLKGVTTDEIRLFTERTGQESLLFVKPAAPVNPFVSAIRDQVSKSLATSKAVVVGIILAESLREADTGPRPSDGESLTPAIDRLQERGVKFANVYSSGPVTRGGQEAAWCSTPSATDTSLMRSFPDASIKCLPAIVRDQKEIKSIWMHGGDRRFDSQLMFWTHQGVSQFLTQDDFPPKTPSTGWGISDLALLEKSAATLSDIAGQPGVKVVLPMILTVTNHIPWAIPSDATLDSKNFIASHDSHKTIRYFDESLDLFVSILKEKQIWERSIFIIAGDHGNLEPSWRNPYGTDPNRFQRLLSHVSLTLTGGIIERLRDEGKIPPRVDEFTAQTQIAPFIAQIAGINTDGQVLDRPLFEGSPWPVASDLNQYLFLPASGENLAKEKVLGGETPEDKTSEWVAATRYRGWLEFLYKGKK